MDPQNAYDYLHLSFRPTAIRDPSRPGSRDEITVWFGNIPAVVRYIEELESWGWVGGLQEIAHMFLKSSWLKRPEYAQGLRPEEVIGGFWIGITTDGRALISFARGYQEEKIECVFSLEKGWVVSSRQREHLDWMIASIMEMSVLPLLKERYPNGVPAMPPAQEAATSC